LLHRVSTSPTVPGVLWATPAGASGCARAARRVSPARPSVTAACCECLPTRRAGTVKR